jgi:leucyl aminopeptidase
VEEVEIEVSEPGDGQPDAVALTLPEGDSTPRSTDDQLGPRLQQLADDGELKGELGRTVVLHTDGTSNARRVVIAGIGKREDVDADAIRTAASAVARRLRDVGGTLAWTLDDSLPLSEDEQARAVVEGAVLGSYSPARWKTEQKPAKRIDKIVFYDGGNGVAATATRATHVAKWVNWARDLANSPPNELTPEDLAARAAELAGGAL